MATFVIEAGPLVKEFHFSEQCKAARSLRRLANVGFAAWLQTLRNRPGGGHRDVGRAIDVDDKG